MRRIAGDTYVFQQDSAPTQRARETVQQLQQETPLFISSDLWPPNSPDLNPVDYRICGWMQQRVYKALVHDTNDLKQRLIDCKDTIFGVHVSPGSAETLVRKGGITNHCLIGCFLSNISAKNHQNRLMCVEVIVCNTSVVF